MAMQTQQRISSASTSPAPYFLPVQQQQSHFSVSSSPSSMKQQNRSQQRGQSTNSYFKTSEATCSKKQKETALESQSSNRLTALHSSLQQEAEKIRKWKNSTELELKNKEKCLNEANYTIENQRKSSTELQLKNESLQSKLSDEITNQKELRRKIASTREMCTALKNHCIKIDTSILKGQEDRDHLMLLNQEQSQNYQELLVRYQQLEEGQNGWHKKYETALSVERDKLAKMETLHLEVSQELEQAVCKISAVERQSSEEKQQILSLTEKVEAKSSEYDSINKEKGELQATLSMKEESLKKSEQQIGDLTQLLNDTEKQLTQYMSQLDQTQSTLETNERNHCDKVSQLEASVVCEKENNKILLKEKADLESELIQTSTGLDAKCQALSTDLEDKIRELNRSLESCQSLKVEQSSLMKSQEELGGAKCQLQLQVLQLDREVAMLKEDLTQQISEREKGLEKAEGLISDVVSRHESARGCWQEKEKGLENQLSELQSEKEAATCELDTLGAQFEELKEKLETQMKVNSEESMKHKDSMEELETEKSSLTEENEAFKKEIHVLNESKECLTAQSENMQEIQAENQKLRTGLEAKVSLSEELHTKILQLENVVSIKDKEQNMLIQQLRTEVSASNTRENENKKAHKLEVAEMKEVLLVKSKEWISQLESSSKETVEARNELNQEQENCKRKVEDLVAALDSYRSERETAMAGKDKIIESLAEEVEEKERAKEASDSKVLACEGEIEQLHSEIEVKNEELKQLLKSVEAVCNKDSNKSGVSSTPLRKTPQTKSRSRATVQLPVAGSVCDNEVSSTPRKKVPSARVHLQPPSTPSKPPISSTPARLYNYSMTATPQHRNKLSSTPKYSSRPKRMRCEFGVSSEEGPRENIAYAQQDEDESVFKKPRVKDASVIIQKASSTTKAKKQNRTKPSSRGKKAPNKDGSSADLSWFDLDAVYGFGSADYD